MKSFSSSTVHSLFQNVRKPNSNYGFPVGFHLERQFFKCDAYRILGILESVTETMMCTICFVEDERAHHCMKLFSN